MSATLVVWATLALAQPKDQTVAQATRLDWAFAARGFGKEGAGLPKGFASGTQKYQLYVPAARGPRPLVVFVSPGAGPAGWPAWKKVCETEGALFCSPYAAGNNVPAGARTRIVLDVVDDVRRKHAVDPNQIVLSGFSGGGRMACAIGFSLPELFSGVVPICGVNPITPPTYLRHRLVERTSVAFVTGATDFNRKENEAYMAPYLEELGVRSKLWVVPGLGHATPGPDVLVDVYRWIKDDVARRKKDAELRPELTMGPSEGWSPAESAERLLRAGQKDLATAERTWRGVSLLQGAVARAPMSDAGKSAAAALKKLANDERLLGLVGEQGAADEQAFLSAQAKALERFGDLPRAAESWRLLADSYPDTPIGRQAVERLRGLKK